MKRTPTPSLRMRVVATVVVLFAALLVIIGSSVDVVLGQQLRRDLEARLSDRATRAVELVESGVGPGDLVQALQGDAIRVRVTAADGTVYGAPGSGPPGPDIRPATPAPPAGQSRTPSPPGPPDPPVPPSDSFEITEPLPDGSTLSLLGDTTAIADVRRQLRILMLVAGAVTLLLAAAALTFAVRRALSPLDSMTSVARRITNGDRGRRLLPTKPNTDLGRTASAVDEMLDALEDAERREAAAARTARLAEEDMRRFLADAAHELRTPVAGISALAQSLQRDAEHRPDRVARWSELLVGESSRASRLVGDMLDSVRAESTSDLDATDIDLVDITRRTVERAALLMPDIRFDVDATQPVPVRVDVGRIEQILSNVLDNAGRFTPSGGTIRVAVGRDTHAFITVDDEGPGVAEADRERIFERLVRLNSARDRASGGVGLGLSIARTLARAHGGELVCLAGPSGARFRLTLPLNA
ncbi:HAMP domain-containing sensor histidine kinase [Rhodococcoides fascians]|uniref:histidine kinase n=1 Tax=freshwater metagenome TaxID=449393 RepID=A0A6J7GP56_9ZZZZ|nr:MULTISPECIES: HAMP domain-containing sensor histidine kinase [Rhodococcus]KJV02069.1 two-component histidine kinase PhoR [Rhodococcus sp. PML026]MSX07392.1 HAMP domain-containing protein [Actinomycetota bacterium]WQH28584.1 HAMP domain-containing sensor histidine kinase [Rhodococcus fascians]